MNEAETLFCLRRPIAKLALAQPDRSLEFCPATFRSKNRGFRLLGLILCNTTVRRLTREMHESIVEFLTRTKDWL